jgi:hypothetical protein
VVSRNPVNKIRLLVVRADNRAAADRAVSTAANRVVSTAANRVNRTARFST